MYVKYAPNVIEYEEKRNFLVEWSHYREDQAFLSFSSVFYTSFSVMYIQKQITFMVTILELTSVEQNRITTSSNIDDQTIFYRMYNLRVLAVKIDRKYRTLRMTLAGLRPSRKGLQNDLLARYFDSMFLRTMMTARSVVLGQS